MNQFVNLGAIALRAAAVMLTLSVAARAEPIERIEVVGQPNGCTMIYRDGVSDRGMTVSYVTLSCPKADRSTQIAERPATPHRSAAGSRQ